MAVVAFRVIAIVVVIAGTIAMGERDAIRQDLDRRFGSSGSWVVLLAAIVLILFVDLDRGSRRSSAAKPAVTACERASKRWSAAPVFSNDPEPGRPSHCEYVMLLTMDEEGAFQFPYPIERGPKTYQELKFITLWEAHTEMPLWEVFWDATRLTPDPAKCEQFAIRALNELRREGLIEAFSPAFAEPEDQRILDDSAFDGALADVSLRSPETSVGRAVAIRWTPAGEQWRDDYEANPDSA